MNLINFIKLKQYIHKTNSSIVDELCGSSFEILRIPERPSKEIMHNLNLIYSLTDSHLPSHAGHTLANYLWWIIHSKGYDYNISKKWRLDGKRIWLESLNETGRKNTGLTVGELIYGQWGKLLPFDARYKPIFDDNIFKHLKKKPLFSVLRINSNWIKMFNSHDIIISYDNNIHSSLHSVLLYGCNKLNDINGPQIHFFNTFDNNHIILSWKYFCNNLYNVYEIIFDEEKWLKEEKWRDYLIESND